MGAAEDAMAELRAAQARKLQRQLDDARLAAEAAAAEARRRRGQ